MISVCMATYNGAIYIKEQIDSILSQIGGGGELIISDDGSTDGTLDIIRSYNDHRIKIIHHKKTIYNKKHNLSHLYTSKNFENAMRHAKGDIIILSDQDDVWLPQRVSTIIKELKEHSLVLCNFNVSNSDGIIVRHGQTFCNPIKKTLLGNIIRMPFFGSAIAFRKEILDLSLPFPVNTVAHDNWIGLLAFVFGKVGYISEPLHNYRRHGENVTHTVTNPLFHKIKYRISLFFNIYKRIITRKYLKNNS